MTTTSELQKQIDALKAQQAEIERAEQERKAEQERIEREEARKRKQQAEIDFLRPVSDLWVAQLKGLGYTPTATDNTYGDTHIRIDVSETSKVWVILKKHTKKGSFAWHSPKPTGKIQATVNMYETGETRKYAPKHWNAKSKAFARFQECAEKIDREEKAQSRKEIRRDNAIDAARKLAESVGIEVEGTDHRGKAFNKDRGFDSHRYTLENYDGSRLHIDRNKYDGVTVSLSLGADVDDDYAMAKLEAMLEKLISK